MKNLSLTLSVFLFLLLGCSHREVKREPSRLLTGSLDYPLIFRRSREILIPKEKSLKSVPEHQVVSQLQTDPGSLSRTRIELVKTLAKETLAKADPTTHTRLIPPPGLPGYSDLELHVNHPYYAGDTLIPAENLVDVWKEQIQKAQKEIILNVFDFDLAEISAELIKKAQEGVQVRVGIDRENVIKIRPEVQKIRDELVAGGVKVTEVFSTGLNHQKVMAIDWTDPEEAAVLFSSGNLTQSCLEPEGDLKGARPLPPESVPNANHMLTMKSWLLANLVHHELTKTLAPEYLLRGVQYPINGSYQITGPGVDPETYEAYPEPSLIVSFTPGGGMKSVNKNIISHFIRKETGRIRLLQFAYSSSEVDKALLYRAEQDYQKEKKFDFLSVGDTPFAMREWSKFLSMSGLKLNLGKKKNFSPDPQNPWVKSLGETLIQDVQKKVYIAPRIYGNNTAKVNGASKKVNAKIHHKILATENYAILGTSFNFSEGAEGNNEQIMVFRDRHLADAVDGMVRYLVEKSPGTVAEEALRRNKIGVVVESGEPTEVD